MSLPLLLVFSKENFSVDELVPIFYLCLAFSQVVLGPDQLSVNDVVWTKKVNVPDNIQGIDTLLYDNDSMFKVPGGLSHPDNMRAMKELDFFNILFPSALRRETVTHTNFQLRQANVHKMLTDEELSVYIGIRLMMSFYTSVSVRCLLCLGVLLRLMRVLLRLMLMLVLPGA
jgi:hypothetical protein